MDKLAKQKHREREKRGEKRKKIEDDSKEMKRVL
jgi:hypothetical protein